MNNEGYQNLMKLSTKANLDGFYYFPRIDHDLLKKYNDGLIALSACLGGEIGQALLNNQYSQAKDIAKKYKDIFGDRYYLEVQDHGHPENPLTNKEQQQVNDQILKLGRELGIKIVVTCDAHYLKHEDQDAHEVLLCIGTGSFVSETKRMSLKEFPLHVETPEKIIKRWGKENPEVITNTKEVADRCTVEFELGKILIPQFPTPSNLSEKQYLNELVYKGLVERYIKDYNNKNDLSISKAKKLLPKEVAERAEYELTVIDNMGFNGYFLIIWDFVSWGKKQGIMFGPGRGSAAGSIIAYALRITDLDPIKHDLLFERFLNPDRISMPDIDIDIQDNRREEVIQYCVSKYGEDRVANITTYGTMAARAAVRDVARVLEVPYSDADRMAKIVPPPVQGRHIPLAKSIKESEEVKKEYQSSPQSKLVYDMAVRLEGTIRNHGVHAAGVVIAPKEIVEYAPLEMAQKGVVALQYPMGIVEELGLLKMDFLGLSNLTTIKNALRIIRKVYGKEIDIESVPLDDKKTYQLLGRGDTTGVFQLESAGMKRYLKDLKPTEFNDIIAMCALYRPGPLKAGLVDMFVKRKNGLEEVSVPHPAFKNALSTTYGTLVYQEQVMQISKEVCGFTGGEADTLRKAIGKKIREVMLKMQQKFIDGGVNYGGVPREIMEKFWEDLMGFADYAFNKSHSACYAMIAYWTAYLKAHYPAAFMAALMTSDYDDIDRLSIEISECKHMGITVLPPDVNESFHEFAVIPSNKTSKPTIRFGMDAIKNVGHNGVANIIENRDKDGPFIDISDFISRVDSRTVNRKVWESLIKSGAVDRFGDRGGLLDSLDNIISTASTLAKEKLAGQVDLFGGQIERIKPDINISTVSQYQERDYLVWERELLGLYLSSHPLEAYDSYLSEKAVPHTSIKPEDDGKSATIGGSVSSLKSITTKNGQNMAFLQLEDIVGDEIEVIVFPKILEKHSDILVKDAVIEINGRVSGQDKQGNALQDPKILAESISVIDKNVASSYQPAGGTAKLGAVKKRQPNNYHNNTSQPPTIVISPDNPINSEKKEIKNPRLYLRVVNGQDFDTLESIKKLLDAHPGDIESVLVVGKSKRPIKLSQYNDGSNELLAKFIILLGDDSVKIV
jgi:DNA polymerase-3 subunit alpha